MAAIDFSEMSKRAVRHYAFMEKAEDKGWPRERALEAWEWLENRRHGYPRLSSYEVRMREGWLRRQVAEALDKARG